MMVRMHSLIGQSAIEVFPPCNHLCGIVVPCVNEESFQSVEQLFSAIENRGITLRSWEWNSRFLETDELVKMMVRISPL
jgi:hypothetical protein